MDFYGLNSEEVTERYKLGKTNKDSSITTKSIGKIIFTNVFTLFNILNFFLAFLIIWVKEYFQASFLVIIILNMSIGLFQELKAKKTIDKLSLISQPKAHVIRNGQKRQINVKELVIDDTMTISSGGQVCSDCTILKGICEVNESMLTGESDVIVKKEGDILLSGSFIVSGMVYAKVINIGKDNYATKICNSAKKSKTTTAQIPLTLRAIIRVMSLVVVPLGLGIFLKSYLYLDINITDSILKMTASTISMVPQGLVALSSVVFATSVIRLSSHKTLSQDLYSIETLARIDTLCLDKTGTITEGSMQLDEIVYINKDIDLPSILSALISVLPDRNPTTDAISEFLGENSTHLQTIYTVPFSSARKWSGASFDKLGTFIMGASEFILSKKQLATYSATIEKYSQQGERVLCIISSKNVLIDNTLPKDTKVLGFLLFSDKIRFEAPQTMRYFYEQGVDIRIISGDNPITVSAIAAKAGVLGYDNFIDASTLKSEQEIIDASRKYKIFGRVTPEQKLSLIKALKADKHTVAMTGDGVNDVLALKESDCSIAMAAGSDAARTVSQLVLLDNNFSSLPKIVAEGRRTINNLQRTASLYLVKTIYSILLAILFLFVGVYPFEPMHLTLIGTVTIGCPSVLLALEQNNEIVRGKFLTNVLNNSVPAALAIFLSISILQICENFLVLESITQLNNISVMLLAGASFGILFKVCKPMSKKLHSFLFFTMLASFIVGWNVFYEFFNLIPIYDYTLNMVLLTIPMLILSFTFMSLLQEKLHKKTNNYDVINKLLSIDKK
jgi:cation-transporting ATPase E